MYIVSKYLGTICSVLRRPPGLGQTRPDRVRSGSGQALASPDLTQVGSGQARVKPDLT
jgi:hypothetical protein